MTYRQYTINEPDVVVKKLGLDTRPVGLDIEKKGSKDSCVVTCIPPTIEEGSIKVSDYLLEKWVEEGVIEIKKR